jgi:hypothetical protein
MTADQHIPNGFLPMSSAPRDGTSIQAVIPGHGSDNVIAWVGGFLNSDEDDCYSWVFMSEQEPPDCWTDGVCWEFNESCKPSVQPIAWKQLEENHD